LAVFPAATLPKPVIKSDFQTISVPVESAGNAKLPKTQTDPRLNLTSDRATAMGDLPFFASIF
jgi:hypothetical protein